MFDNFDWLEREIAAVKTPKFHVVERNGGGLDWKRGVSAWASLPSPYREFVTRFGTAKLYRNPRNNGYRVGVLAEPAELPSERRSKRIQLGWHDGATVYVKSGDASVSSVFELEEAEEKVAESFEEWLFTSCTRARGAYGKKEWAQILRGPPPFTLDEKAILNTRRLINWKLLGVDADRNHMFEVSNASGGCLPALTVGVRSRDKRLNGAVRLDIGHIKPGQSGILRVGCYKNLVSPSEIEVFALPEPNPEDREYYWELRGSK